MISVSRRSVGTTVESAEITNDTIVNADIKSDAAIAYSKLAALTSGNILVGNGSNVATSVNPSGVVDIDNTGAFTFASDMATQAELDTHAADTTSVHGISDTAAIPDGNLASANNSVYKTIYAVNGSISPDAGADTRIFYELDTNGSTAGSMQASGTSGTAGYLPYLFYFDDADYAVAGLTTRLRLRFQVACNATALSSVTLTAGLYPVTVAGGADAIAFTAGTVVTGSTVAVANATASTISQGNSGDFTVPSDGAYCFAVVQSATLTNNSLVTCHLQLQYRHT